MTGLLLSFKSLVLNVVSVCYVIQVHLISFDLRAMLSSFPESAFDFQLRFHSGVPSLILTCGYFSLHGASVFLRTPMPDARRYESVELGLFCYYFAFPPCKLR